MVIIMVTKTIAVLVPCSLLRTHIGAYAISDAISASNAPSVLCFSMTTGLILAGFFLGFVVLMNWGGGVLEGLKQMIERINKKKQVLRKRVSAVKTKLKKPRVVKTLTDEQIPKVKKQIEEISTLINRHMDTVHQQRDAAVALAHSSGLTAGLAQYEKEYARQVDMINAAVPRLITEADRISAVDEVYKQQIHDWVLALRESLESCNPKHFEQMARVGNGES
jgi:hypothetical protein